jgi:hypothetical protein
MFKEVLKEGFRVFIIEVKYQAVKIREQRWRRHQE